MPVGRTSLLAGRNVAPLDDGEIRRVASTFIGLDSEANFRHEEAGRTRCRVYEENNEVICEIVFGPDIYPGTGMVDPNSILSMRAAAAHELSHFHRWKDKLELDGVHLSEIDEALTSLDAIARYHNKLSESEVRQLAADAMQRLQAFVNLHIAGFKKSGGAESEV